MAEKTFEEMSAELEKLNTQIKEAKEFRDELARQYKESAELSKEYKAVRIEILAALNCQKKTEKINKKQEHLAELLRAKEEAEKLGIKVRGHKSADTAMPQAAAAHESALEGDLTENVNIDDLESELNLF
jgi:pyridoxine 5'-phosphate synthase PdxJ